MSSGGVVRACLASGALVLLACAVFAGHLPTRARAELLTWPPPNGEAELHLTAGLRALLAVALAALGARWATASADPVEREGDVPGVPLLEPCAVLFAACAAFVATLRLDGAWPLDATVGVVSLGALAATLASAVARTACARSGRVGALGLASFSAAVAVSCAPGWSQAGWSQAAWEPRLIAATSTLFGELHAPAPARLQVAAATLALALLVGRRAARAPLAAAATVVALGPLPLVWVGSAFVTGAIAGSAAAAALWSGQPWLAPGLLTGVLGGLSWVQRHRSRT